MRTKFLLLVLCCATFVFCASAGQRQQKVNKAKEKDPEYQYNVGLVYLNQSNVDPKNIDEAMKYFVKCLALDTRFYLAWNGVGMAQSLKGNLAESAKAYLKCLEINPRFAEAHNNLGTIYQEMGQLDKAEAEFKAAATDPTYISRELPYFNLARLYFVQDRLDEAYADVQMAINIKPRMGMAHNLRGQILEKQNKEEEAVFSFEQAVKLVPDDVLFGYNLGVAYFRNGELDRARDTLLKISPRVTDPEMRDNITKILKQISEKRSAV